MGSDFSEKSHLLPIKYPVRRLSTPPSSQGKGLEVPDQGKKRSHSDQARSRTRTISFTVFNFMEDSIHSTVSTSYGPVVISDATIPGYGGCLGIFLAAISGILFTVNNFLFQYLDLNVTDMLLTRSGMQTAVLGLILVVTGGCSTCVPVRCMDWVLVISQALFNGARVGLTFACLEYLPFRGCFDYYLLWTSLDDRLCQDIPKNKNWSVEICFCLHSPNRSYFLHQTTFPICKSPQASSSPWIPSTSSWWLPLQASPWVTSRGKCCESNYTRLHQYSRRRLQLLRWCPPGCWSGHNWIRSQCHCSKLWRDVIYRHGHLQVGHLCIRPRFLDS